MFIVQQVTHGSTVKGKNGYHVGSIKLQEGLVEYHWVWLVLYQLYDIRLSLANKETLKEQKLSQSNFMDLDTVDILIISFSSTVGI